ncbi:EF-hand domain-containing protein [Shimia sp. R11_0]|uniref:EF-hand domain-containing protein n=1 Tax=Shimia sp. R11_0 TaxID=2821096 RepID=UPI001ADB2413|nr:EF-hand domain-containing protein [Shimia sp. R11_0]MBO9476650.1 EF-hand domain-containing protein [Shimia sp. R11_0]
MRNFLIGSALVSFSLLAAPTLAAADDWDMDADGTITWAEVEETRKRIFETFDKDGDGALDNAEYTAFDEARAAEAESNPTSLAKRAVAGLSRANTDLNLDGRVTRAEMDTAMRAWFDNIDKDGDGVITKGEY